MTTNGQLPPAGESDAELVARCQAGSTEAFEVLVKRYAGRAIGTATALLGSAEDAQDISQEAFVRSWRAMKRFRGQSSFFTWYSTILRNACISHRRRRANRPTAELPDSEAGPADATDAADPERLAVRDERTRLIWQAVMGLSDNHREVIVMHHFQHMSYQQMADILEVPIGTVTSRLYKARQALRQQLQEYRP